MPKSDFIVELVNAFNLNNYFCDRVNTNFTVEGRKIVGLFAKGTDVAKYLRGVGEEIIKQQYLGSEVVAGRYYNLNCFPFVLGANPSKKESGIGGVMKVELADSANKEVIRNLKIHLVNEFRRAVTLKVIACLVETAGITEEEGHEWVGGAVKIGAFDESNLLKRDYLYCIAFDGEYFEREGYDSETFELFKGMYIQEFNSRLRACGLKNSDFYDYKDGMLYIKNASGKVVGNVAKYVKKEAALDFRTPGKEDSKVENFKDVLSGLISKQIGKSISGYDYDVFINQEEINDGNSFVLIPLIMSNSHLKHNDVYRVNARHKGFLCDIKGKTANLTNYQGSVHAISNKGIAQLLPEIMQSPIAYNERTGHFEFVADLGPSSRVDMESPRPVPVFSPVLRPQPGTGVAVPGTSMSDQNPDEGYDSPQGSSGSLNKDPVYTSTASITLKPKDNKITKSDDSGVVLVYDSRKQDLSGTDSKSELLRSESNLSDVSISSSINDTEVYQQFSRPSSRRGSNRSIRSTM
ncbi:MAG: hypothetical protein PG978_000736 [Wolbachia endosymbiont of Ctenocephalides felis wCfeF]|nr:MAG: hypothetical protein PG978_000736 [Wolbachia endosymbiont of Ctenocephalides felis wCfeF]